MRISDYTLEEQRAWFFRALELAALETTGNIYQASVFFRTHPAYAPRRSATGQETDAA